MLLLFLSGTGALLSQLDWFHAAGSALFLGASLLQHQSIVLLASLRIGKSGEISRSSLRKKQLPSAEKQLICICQSTATVIFSRYL